MHSAAIPLTQRTHYTEILFCCSAEHKHSYSLATFKNQTKPNIVVDQANDIIKCVSESMIRNEIFLPNSVIALS